MKMRETSPCPLLISLHLPKAAGTSFAASLQACVGRHLLMDYADMPINTPVQERHFQAMQAALTNAEQDFQDVRCIHGHFLPIKYLLLASYRSLTFTTWMRNPVDRLVSNYFFWKDCFDPEQSPALHRKVVEEGWSLEKFCLSEEMRNVYDQFLWGFSIDYFDFIGITEHYEEDVAVFSQRYFNRKVEVEHLNKSKTEGFHLDEGLKYDIETYHAKDMELYRIAVNKRILR